MAKAAVLASISLLANHDEATNAMAKSFITSYKKVMRLMCAWSEENEEETQVAAKPGGMPARFAALCILTADLRTVIEALEALAAIPGSNLFMVEAKGKGVRVIVHADAKGNVDGALFPKAGGSTVTSELSVFAETYNGCRVDDEMLQKVVRMRMRMRMRIASVFAFRNHN
jgi:hypothetical protein